ncbi:hypothetical protein BGZ63DRAFT_52314 [Mariannaea sp. PMI_226]|nr:hypothetical protein BGZ63DRAFT_52314 [Mariannaea sp. PMI_226]
MTVHTVLEQDPSITLAEHDSATMDKTLARDANSLFDLELIRDRSLTDQDVAILNAFSHAMRPATLETAAEAAYQLDFFCPPLEEKKEAEDYLWQVWVLMLDIAQSPGVTSEIQGRLISVAENVRRVAKGELWGKRVWGDSPLLGDCIDMNWRDPAFESSLPRAQIVTPQRIEIWQNINNFLAQCLKAEVCGPMPWPWMPCAQGLRRRRRRRRVYLI